MNLPQGFTASGVACGLKPSGRPDVGLLVSERPATAVGVFTQNRVQAAPVTVTRAHLRRGSARAIVANAGNANACTGMQGLSDATAMAERAGKHLGVNKEKVLVASTGVIGVPMDMAAASRGIDAAVAALSRDGLDDLVQAIMTTDTRPKVADAGVGGARIVGVAKGAGMIAPEMATMLCFIVTDAVVDRSALSASLQGVTRATFNAISVDGCMSTNDCVLVLANGASGVTPDDGAITAGLWEVCGSLAQQIVADGEGASKVVAVRVLGASDEREARKAARAVADSVLLRCALNGADPNWGRVLAALGASGVPFDPNLVDVWLGGEKMCARGAVGPGDRDKARLALLEREVEVRIDLNRGPDGWTLWTNDLSAEYVRINAEYTT